MAIILSLIRTAVHEIKARKEAKHHAHSYEDTKSPTALITNNARLHHVDNHNDEKDLPPSYELCVSISPSTAHSLPAVDISKPSTTTYALQAMNTLLEARASTEKGGKPQRMSCCERKRQRRAERQARSGKGGRGCCGRKQKRCGGC